MRRHSLGQRGSILAGAMMIMTLLIATSLVLLSASTLENARTKRQERYLQARLRAEGACCEGAAAIRAFYANAAATRTSVWDLVGDGDPGYVIRAQSASSYMGGTTTLYCYVVKVQSGGYEQYTNYAEAVSDAGRGQVVRMRLPTWNMRLSDYSMWAHGADEVDSSDYSFGSRSADIQFTPGDYCVGHAYASGNVSIMSGSPRATFLKRAESAGSWSGAANGTFAMTGQPRQNVPRYVLDYRAGFWSHAKQLAGENGIRLPAGYDYVVDLDQISTAIRNGQSSLTIKRRVHRADTSPSIEGDQATLQAATGKTTITQLPIWTATTQWQDSNWLPYWANYTVTLPTRANYNGVIFAGDCGTTGSVSSTQLSSVLIRGSAQLKSTSVVCTDDLYFVGNTYGGSSNGDFSRRTGNWSAGTGTPTTLAVCAKDEIQWSLVMPRATETMCGMFSQYGRFYSETKSYADKLFRMPSQTEWDYDYDFQIDPDANLWNGALRERDGKNTREYGRGTRTVSLLSRSWTKNFYDEAPWIQRTGGPWVGSGGYDNATYWNYPTYVGNGSYSTLAYDVDPNLSNAETQPPVMPVIMNGFQLGAFVEQTYGLDTHS